MVLTKKGEKINCLYQNTPSHITRKLKVPIGTSTCIAQEEMYVVASTII